MNGEEKKNAPNEMQKLPKDVIDLIASFIPNLRKRGGRYWTTLTITFKLAISPFVHEGDIVIPRIHTMNGISYVNVNCYSLIYNNNQFLITNQLTSDTCKIYKLNEENEWIEDNIRKDDVFQSTTIEIASYLNPKRIRMLLTEYTPNS